MSKRARKRRDRKKGGANHGMRPNTGGADAGAHGPGVPGQTRRSTRVERTSTVVIVPSGPDSTVTWACSNTA